MPVVLQSALKSTYALGGLRGYLVHINGISTDGSSGRNR